MGFFFKPWKKISLFTRIMIGFAIGIIIGLIFGPKASVLSPLGTILTNLLTMVVAPLVFCLLVCAAADVGDGKRLGRIGLKTMVTFLVSTAFAIVIGLFMANIMNIGAGVTINLETAKAQTVKEVSFINTLIDIIPKNIFNALTNQNLLQIIFFSLILGFALMKIGDKGKTFLDMCRSGQEAMKEITNIVLDFTPYGVLGLMANVVGKNGPEILIPYLKTIVAMYIAAVLYTLLIQAFLMVGVIGRVNPVRFLKEMKEAIAFVFATCSSVATIPLNLAATKRVGVDEETANFVVPFGAVMNMNGTAIYEAIAVVFTAQIFGIELSITNQIMIMLTATLASIGTAGVPGSGLVMLTIVLTSVNLPMEAIGLLAGIDRILNMARVIPNITGDAATAVIVARTEGTLKVPENK